MPLTLEERASLSRALERLKWLAVRCAQMKTVPDKTIAETFEIHAKASHALEKIEWR